jgi:leucyl-tRNA synthetase
MKRYNPKEIEPKWQKAWEQEAIYSADFNSGKPKYVGFAMFNYPSGAGYYARQTAARL